MLLLAYMCDTIEPLEFNTIIQMWISGKMLGTQQVFNTDWSAGVILKDPFFGLFYW